jgi:O-glycosyl hydrolase
MFILSGFFLLCISCKETPLADYQLVIDPSVRYQNIQGFGASDAWRCQFVGKFWPEEKREAIADLLFSQEFDEQGNPEGIGLSIWRFYLGSGTAEMGDASGIKNEWRRAECFQNPDGSYDWSKHDGQRWFLEAARRRGVDKYLAFSITPPVHMSKNGMGHSPRGDISMNISEGMMDNYAGFLSDVMLHFQDAGIPFDFLSPVNEPQWNWDGNSQEGSSALNEDLHELISALSDQFLKKQVSAQIVMGEAATINHLSGFVENDSRDNQIEYFFGGNSAMNISSLPNVRRTITGHSYFTTWPLDSLVSSRQKLARQLAHTDPELEYWQTEFCILEENPEIGGGNHRDLQMPTALYVSRVIHSDLVMNNACSWQWWTALSQCDYKDGLIYLDTGHGNGMTDPGAPINDSLKYDGIVRESKLLWAYGNYSRFIRPGARRIKTEFVKQEAPLARLTGLTASGYQDPLTDQIILVLINQENMDKKLTLLSPNGNSIDPAKGIETFTTSATKDLFRERITGPSLDIEALSVTTVIIGER